MNPFGTYSATPAWRNHVCGLYYVTPLNGQLRKTYLPQVELQAHSTILSTTSRTTLAQTFVNPSTTKGIREVRYTFPLYDGVSVVGFTCLIGERSIVGEVKEKEKAKAVFQEAVARSETAGLLEQLPDASDVFTTTVGNIPPKARVIIKITYLGELKHDMEVDGIRFTVPNIICPRYGDYPGTLTRNTATEAVGNGISITVDTEMAERSFIQKILSPTHPISVSMGTTSFAPNAEPTMTKASATLSLGVTHLDTDFVLQVVAKDTGVPKAFVESHPTIPNHRALMATLVPKFALPPEKPEIVFVCDRSGSMGGNRIELVRQALKVFLKSLPVGVKFNICSFGSSYSFLWPKSVTYSQQSLNEAIAHAETFYANYGGTEMLPPITATIEQRYKDMPLDVMLLTDGEIWDQQGMFSYLNKGVSETKTPIRVFTFGIGNGVSHALIEGIARAGNGFSQTVGEGEKMDTKVVRMLKGALSPHINDYTLEVKYSDNAQDTSVEEDGFEVIEKVIDSLTVKLDLKEKEEKQGHVGFQSQTMRAFFADYYQKKPISLFDQSADPDKEEPPASDESGEFRYAHLPEISVPKIIQAPQNIPPLFAFNRMTVYLLLGPNAPSKIPMSVVLRGTSAHGPLELEIPVQILDTPGEMIHQLAAKKAIAELEQGRGWLPEAKYENGTPIKQQFEGHFDDMVEREAVRLGVQFHVGGKWCPFVAVERKMTSKMKVEEDFEWLDDETIDLSMGHLTAQSESGVEESVLQACATANLNSPVRSTYQFADTKNEPISRLVQKIDKVDGQIRMNRARLSRLNDANRLSIDQDPFLSTTQGERLDTLNTPSAFRTNQAGSFHDQLKKLQSNDILRGLFGNSNTSSSPGSQATSGGRGGLFRKVSDTLFGSSPSSEPAYTSARMQWAMSESVAVDLVANAPQPQGSHALQDHQMPLMLMEQQNKKRLLMARQDQASRAAPPPPPPPQTGAAPIPPPTYSASAPASAKIKMFSGGIPSPAPAPAPAPQFQQLQSMSLFGTADQFGSAAPAAFGSAPALFPTDGAAPQGATSITSATYIPAGEPFGPGVSVPPLAQPIKPIPKTDDEILDFLIALQTFEGFWEWRPELFTSMKISEAGVEAELQYSGVNKNVYVTALVVAFFEERLEGLQGSWELVVDKAKGWLADNTRGGKAKAEELLNKARVLV